MISDELNGILVAEEHGASRELLERNLTYWGFQVMVATDGSEALRLLEAPSAPCIALLDREMPRVDGPEVCRRVRAQNERPYQYLMLLGAQNGKNQEAKLEDEREVPADEVVERPVTMEELRVRLQVAQRVVFLERVLARIEKKVAAIELDSRGVRMGESLCQECGRWRDGLMYRGHLEVHARVHCGDGNQNGEDGLCLAGNGYVK